MSLDITTLKLTGPANSSGWAQVHEYFPESEQIAKARGSLFVVFSAPETTQDKLLVSRSLIRSLHEKYFELKDKTPFNALRDSVSAVGQQFSKDLEDLELIAVAFLDGVLYAASFNGGEIALYRNGIFAKILTGIVGGVSGVSGYATDGDRLILGTNSFFNTVTEGVLKASFERGDFQDSLETLTPFVYSSESSGRTGTIFLKFGNKGNSLFKRTTLQMKMNTDPGLIVNSNLFEGLLNKAGNFFQAFKGRLVPANLYIDRQEGDQINSSGKKSTLIIGIILVVMLTISIVFGLYQKVAKEKKSKYETTLTQAEHDYQESLSLYTIDPVRARSLFNNSKTLVDELLRQDIKDKSLEELKQNLSRDEGRIIGIYKEEGEVFVDLTLLKQDFNGSLITKSDSFIYILDKNQGVLLKVNAETKRAEILIKEDKLKSCQSISSYQQRVFAVLDDGIYEISGGSLTKRIDSSWSGDVKVASFAGNVYLLDKNDGTILRFAGVSDKFTTGSGWLAGYTLDFSGVSGFVIDGYVWVLGSGGKIIKFSLGNQVDFSLYGFDDSFTPQKMYTDEDAENLYFLDSGGGRVLVFAKTGEYKLQYRSDKTASATEIVVAENDKKMFLLSGGILYSLEIAN